MPGYPPMLGEQDPNRERRQLIAKMLMQQGQLQQLPTQQPAQNRDGMLKALIMGQLLGHGQQPPRKIPTVEIEEMT